MVQSHFHTQTKNGEHLIKSDKHGQQYNVQIQY